MTELIVELPDTVMDEIEKRQISGDVLSAVVQNAIEQWLVLADEASELNRPAGAVVADDVSLWDLWDQIQMQAPVEIEIPARSERANPLLDPDYELSL